VSTIARPRNEGIPAMLAEFARRPAETATVTFDSITAGALIRRHVRTAISMARIRGAQVDCHEDKGFWDSVFTIRLRGTAGQLVPSLRVLAELEEAGR
jgi:hypothetical protein